MAAIAVGNYLWFLAGWENSDRVFSKNSQTIIADSGLGSEFYRTYFLKFSNIEGFTWRCCQVFLIC